LKITLSTMIAVMLCVMSCSTDTNADIVLSNFVSMAQDIDPGANLIQSGYTPTSGSDSVLFVTFSFDAPGDPADSVTFGGTALTKVETGANRIFYLTHPGTTAGDIVLNTASGSDGGGNELLTIGTLLGVDTTSITSLIGSTNAGSIQSGPDFTGLDPNSYVLTQFIANNHNGSYSAVPGNAILASIDGGGGAFDGAVTGASNVSGDFTASVDGFISSNGTTAISIAFGAAAVPEPGSLGLLGLMMAGLVTRRYRNS